MNINGMKLAKLEKELIGYLHENDYSKNTEIRYYSVSVTIVFARRKAKTIVTATAPYRVQENVFTPNL